MSLRLRLTAAVLATAALAGCGEDAPSAGPTAASGSSATRTAVPPAGLLAPVAAYVDAVERRDLDALAGAFASDAVLVDVGRRFAGRDAIRGWAEREVIGGSLKVDRIVENRPGYQKLLVTFAPGGSGGFAAHYAFTTKGSAIARADLTYAD